MRSLGRDAAPPCSEPGALDLYVCRPYQLPRSPGPICTFDLYGDADVICHVLHELHELYESELAIVILVNVSSLALPPLLSKHDVCM